MNNRLHNAAADKNGFALVTEIIEQDKTSVNLRHTEFGTRPAAFAAQSGSVETLQYLIKNDAILDASGPNEKNLLEWALQNTQEMIEYIAAPENHFIEKFQDGTTAFHAAIAAGRIDEVKKALEENPSLLFEENDKGLSPLDWVFLAERYEIGDSLINHIGYFLLSEDHDNEDYSHSIDCLCKYTEDLCRIDEIARAIEVMSKLLFYCLQAELPEQLIIKLYCQIALLHLDKNDLSLADLSIAQENYRLAKELYSNQNNEDGSSSDADSNEQQLENVKAELTLSLAASERGFRCQNMKADGACFYHALADQLSLQDGKFEEAVQDQLRELVVRHLTENESLYAPFVDNQKNSQFQSYLESIRRPDYWVDHLAIQALSREFNATFVIIRSDERKPDIIRQAEPAAVLYFGYITDRHYQSLHRLANVELNNALLESEINAAEIDQFTGVIVRQSQTAEASSATSATSATSETDNIKQVALLNIHGHFSNSNNSASNDEDEVSEQVKRRRS